jgi:hypothetical protein
METPLEDYLRVFSDNGQELQVERDVQKDYSFVVLPFEDSTGVCLLVLNYGGNAEDSYLKVFYVRINADGSVASNLEIDDLPVSPIQIVGEKHVIFCDYDDAMKEMWYLTDLSGNIVMEDVTPILVNDAAMLTQGMGSAYIYDYFMKDGQVYDAQLNPVPEETRSADGRMIPGVKYYVDGIACEVWDGFEDSDRMPQSFEYSVATGQGEDGSIAVKCDWGECVINDVGDDVYVKGVNSSLLVLSNYTIYSIITGEFIANTRFGNASGPQIEIADEYLLLNYEFGFSIIDNDGNLRYVSDSGISDSGTPRTTSGEYFLLWNDSVCILADLNGETVLESQGFFNS